MNQAPSKPTLNLTPAMFFTGTQAIVLTHRHGRSDEDDTNFRMDKNNSYQAASALLRHRELSACEITMETAGLIVNLRLKRCYHHEGRLCRVHYLSESASEIRRKGLKTHEIELAQVAAWAAARHYATPPNGVRLVYHVLAADDNETAVTESWVVDLPLEPRAKVEKLVVKKLKAIEAALTLDDERLPECDMDERQGTDAKPFQKCFDYCLARRNCRQFARYVEQRAKRGTALPEMFAALGTPNPAPSPASPSQV